MNEKLLKIKTHLKENKKVYIAGGVCLIVGIATGVLLKQNGNTSSMTRLWSPGDNNLIQISIPKPGNSGNMIYCAMNDTYYPSQNKIAKALGENKGQISKLLSGALPDVKGYGLEKIAENGVRLAA